MALDNPNSGNNSGNIGDLSELVGAITALNTNNRKILEVLESIDKNNISRDDFRNLIRDVNRNNSSSNTNNNNSNSSRSRNRDYEPRIDLSRDRRYQNEMTQNLERSNRIIQDFSRIINNTNASFNNLNRILDESNRRINRNLDSIGSLDFTRATQGLQHSLDSFIRGTSDELNSSLSSLRRFQDNLNNRIRNENNDLIRSSRERLGQFNTQSNRIQSDLVSVDRRDLDLNNENNALAAELSSLTDRLSAMPEEMNSLYEAERIAQSDERLAIEDALNILTIQHNHGEIDDLTWITESIRLQDREQQRLEQVQSIIQQQQRLLDEHAENERRQQEIIDRQSQIPNELAQNAEDRNKLNADSERLNENARRYEQSLVERAELERQAEEVLNRSLGRTQDRLRDITEAVDTQAQLLDTSRDLRRGAGIIPTEFSNISDILANAFGFNTEDQEEQKLKPFEELIESYNRALADNQQKIEQLNQEYIANQERIAEIDDANNGELVNTQRTIDVTTEKLNQLQAQLSTASDEDKQRIQEDIERTKEDHENLLIQAENLKNEAELLKAENNNIEANKAQLQANEKLLEQNKQNAEQMLNSAKKNLGLFPQLINKALTGAGKLIKKGISEVEDYIKQAANDVFDSFERLQQSIGKTLKMNSGAYEEFKEQMIAAADEAGLAIDVTQLNEVASSMSELGIRDTELLKDFAVGATILSESGSTLKLNEDTVRQLNASYQANIRNGMSQQQASEALIDNFYEIAAAEKMMVDKYGNTLALSNGGQDIIQQLFAKLSEAGYLQAEDFGTFFTNMSQYLGAMESAGIDSSTLMQDFDSILAGNISGLNTELKAWFQDNPYKTTDDFYRALATDFGSVAKSLVTFQSSLYQNMDEQDISYVGPAFGSNRTNWQLMGIQQRTDTVNELFEDSVSTNDRLESAVSDIKTGLEDGTWLTATDRLNKRAINFVDNMASEFQDLPDGKVIMNEGFAVVTERLNSIIDGIGNILTALLTGNLINNPLNPAGGGGGIAGSQLGSFLIGGSGTAGTAGQVVGSVAGAGMMGYSIAQHTDELYRDGSDGIYNLLTDSTFTAGFGTMIGGAMGGPVGAAVGGVIGKFIPTVEGFVETGISKLFHGDDSYLSNQAELEAAEKLQQAAEDLTNSALDHSNNAKVMKSDLESQQKAFNTFSDDEKATWLLQHEQFLKEQGIIDEQHGITKEDGKNNEMFQNAINSWAEYMQKEADKETALGEADRFTEDLSLVQDNSGLGISLEDVEADTSIYGEGGTVSKSGHVRGNYEEQLARTEKRKAFADRLLTQYAENSEYASIIESYGVSASELTELATLGEGSLMTHLEDFTNAYTAVQERLADKKAIMESGDFDTKLETIKKWATANDDAILDKNGNFVGFEDFEKSVTEYLMATGSFTEEEAKSQAELYASLQDSYSIATDAQNKIRAELIEKIRNYNENGKKTYGEIINEIVAENAKNAESPDYIDYSQYIDTSSEEYNQWANQYQSEDYQTRKSTAESIPLNIGKYATGLEYVPYDDFPALLHEGETVLDPENAEAYRSLIDSLSNVDTTGTEGISLATLLDSYNNSYNTTSSETYGSILDTTPITTSVDKQTNIVVDLLTKILNILTTNVSTANKSYLPKSLIQYDSNLNRL